MIENLLAKSNPKEKLINHNVTVALTAEKIFEKLNNTPNTNNLKTAVVIGALLHDIGKATEDFQKILLKEESEEITNIDLHNETGWLFLSQYLDVKDRENTKILQDVLNVIFWHHGVYKRHKELTPINSKDIEIMRKVLQELLDKKEFAIYTNIFEVRNTGRIKNSPRFYFNEEEMYETLIKNATSTYIRSCVISADRLVSKLSTNIIFINKPINERLLVVTNILKEEDLDLPSYQTITRKDLDKERLQNQIAIVNQIVDTTIVKAPAGFGKTILGLLWQLKTKKKVIWVCPRNIIAEQVYKSLTEEITKFSLSLKTELFLTGIQQETNCGALESFTGDVIITNIDNFLSPTADNHTADRLYTIINYNVVFDEFHELISDEGLFGAFINLMYIRHNFVKGETLLLSATPSLLHEMWEAPNHLTKILPSKTEHYSPIHNKPYKVFYEENHNIVERKEQTLYVHNTINLAQDFKRRFDSQTEKSLLLHSNFTDNDRSDKVKTLYAFYGKQALSCEKPYVIGTPVIQASLDISFTHLKETVLSPESSIQRIGRCNRWGESDKATISFITNEKDGRIISKLYSSSLNNCWKDFLQKSILNDQKISLEDIYKLYNEFNIQNREEIKRFLQSKLVHSLEKLHENIFPRKNKKPTSTGILTTGNVNLRTSSSSIFITVKDENGKYIEPLNYPLYNNKFSVFENNDWDKIQKEIKTLSKEGRFNFKEKYKNINELQENANRSDTPYIVLSKSYSREFGIEGLEE